MRRSKYVQRVTCSMVREPGVEVQEVTAPAQVAKLCEDLANRDREVFRVLYLDTRSRVVAMEDVSVGILNASLVHPREVFKGAIMSNASHMILVHNHPTGDVSPSQEDRLMTKRLVEAGKIMGIPVVDHVIVGREGWASLKDLGVQMGG